MSNQNKYKEIKKEFYKSFVAKAGHIIDEWSPDDIWNFIEKVLDKNTNEVIERIGMLRQWLNEDRIDDPKKMVTNKDIKEWLLKK